MKTICNNYIQFSNLKPGSTITLEQFHNIFDGGSSVTIKDNSVRGAKTISYWDVKVGDKVNNGTRFIEIIEN